MPREVTDSEGITWTCIQAYSGLSDGDDKGAEKQEAARTEGPDERYHVVCTPSGGAKSVRVQLHGDWEEALSDDELLREIDTHRE